MIRCSNFWFVRSGFLRPASPCRNAVAGLLLSITCSAFFAGSVLADGNFALSFDGIDDYVSVQNVSGLNAYPLTVMAWIKTTQTNGYAGLVNKYVSGSENGWQIYLLNGNVRAFYFKNNTSYVWDGGDGLNGGFVADGNWHNVAFALDTTTSRLFVDGVKQSSLAWTGIPGPCTTTQGVSLGLYPGSAYFQGTMDEVAIWDTALIQPQIQTNMNRSLIGSEPGLIAYYRLDEGSSVFTEDSAPVSGNNYGSLMNGPLWVPGLILGPGALTQPASQVSSTFATLNGVGNPSDTNSTAWFQWGTTTAYGNLTPPQPLGSGVANVNFSQAISNLGKGVTYQFQAVTSNNLGVTYGGNQSFLATATNMLYGRVFHTATLLSTGKVLVTGGEDQFGNAISNAELYDTLTGTFAATSPMTVGRYHHTATLLPNGKVLVAGGAGNYPAIFASAELYDPVAGTWSPTGSMIAGCYSHTATLLTNGKILVAGGAFPNASAPASQLYDPAAGTWSLTGASSINRSSHTATLLTNGNVLLAGGLDTNNKPLSISEVYNPGTASWTTTPGAAITKRYSHVATLLPGGKVMVTGGFDGTNFLSSAELFNPVTGTWAATGSMLNYRFGAVANLLPNGTAFVTGDGVGSPSIYTPTNGTWTDVAGPDPLPNATSTLLPDGRILLTGGSLGLMPSSSATVYVPPDTGSWATNKGPGIMREFATTILLPNGKVLLMGGDDGFIYPNIAYLFDPATGTWTSNSVLSSVGREQHTVTLLATGKVLVCGGNQGGSELNDALLYNPSNSTWASTGGMAAGRYSHTATLLTDGKVLAAGGYSFNNNAYLSSTELYDPASGHWSSTGAMKNSRGSHTATLLPDGRVLVAGGAPNISSFATSAAELYDPAAGTWTATAPMITPRASHAAILLPGGKVLVAGGQATNGASLASAELFDPIAGTWTATGSMLSGRANFVVALLANGKVLATTGAGVNSEVYDPIVGTWTATGPLNKARNDCPGTLLPNGEVLLATGFSGGILTNSELYDTGTVMTNSWRPQITTATSPLALDGTLTINGAQFRGISEASSGTSQDSSADYPLVQLRSLESSRTLFFPVTNWSANAAITVPVTGFPPGYALAWVFVNGMSGTGAVVSVSVPVPSAPQLTNSRFLSNGSFQFAFSNSPGAIFAVLSATNVATPLTNWTVQSGVTEIAPGKFQFTAPLATNSAQKFFRVRSP
jgi:N-acetylneuraminic acid mutarotase